MKTTNVLVLCGTLLALSSFAQPTVTLQPTNLVVAPGGNGGFTAMVTGTGPFTYQWLFKGTNLPATIITTVVGGGVGDGNTAVNAVLSTAGAAVDGAGNLFIADSGNHRIRKVDTNGVITTVAGNGSSGFSGDGGAATAASLYSPKAVALDGAGNLFIADYSNSRVRKVYANGIITTIAGNGSSAYSGDGGRATNAGLPYPYGVAADPAGNVFIVDYFNNRIRRVDTNGFIRTVAGTNGSGFNGDGILATNAMLYSPASVAADAGGNLFIDDLNNRRIRKVDTNGFITTVAGKTGYGFSGDGGPATNALLSNMTVGVSVDGAGNLFIADQSNNRIRKVDASGVITTVAGNGSDDDGSSLGDGSAATNAPLAPQCVAADPDGSFFVGSMSRFRKVDTNGIITTFAGNGSHTFGGDGGLGGNAVLYYPSGVTVDRAGQLFIADQYNVRIRKVATNGIVTTVAGNGVNGFSGDGGPATNAKLNEPYGTAVDASNNLFIVDWRNYRIREVDTAGSITTWAGGGTWSPPWNGLAATNANISPYGAAIDNSNNLLIAASGAVYWVDTNGLIYFKAGTGYSGFSGDGGLATSAKLSGASSVAQDSAGNVFIADSANYRIRKVDTNGMINTIAGKGSSGFSGDGGPATNALLSLNVSGVAVDSVGNVLIADQYNNRIRKVDTNGIITTVAGSGGNGNSGDGGAATNAKLSQPYGIAVDAANNFYIADMQNHRIRKVSNFANLPTLMLNNVTTNNAGNYQVIVTGAGGSVTSLVATLTVSLGPPAFGTCLLNSDRSLTLNLTCPPGSTGRLWAATNLVPPISWQPVSTNPSGGNWQYTESNTTALPWHFYRLSTP